MRTMLRRGAVALEGEVFLIIVHVENGLGRVHHAPHDRDADLDGVAEAVVYLLAGVIEGHYLERDLLAGILGQGHGIDARAEKLHRLGRAAVHVTALVELRLGRGVDADAEGIDKVEAGLPQRAGIVAEQASARAPPAGAAPSAP